MADVDNKRLARIKEKIMCWNFNVIYNPGKMQNAADVILRCKPLHMLYISASQEPISSWDDDIMDILKTDLEVVHMAIHSVSSDVSWNRVHRVNQEDRTLLRMMDHIQRGMPDSGLELDKDLREFHLYRQDLHVVDSDTGSTERTRPGRDTCCAPGSVWHGCENR